MNLIFSTETGAVKKYVKCMKTKSISEISKSMIEDYKNLNDEEKFFIRYSLNDAINDMEKGSLLSIIITILFKILINNIIVNIILLFLLSICFIELIKYYRMCKLYLEVINDFRLGYISEEKSCSRLREILNNRN